MDSPPQLYSITIAMKIDEYRYQELPLPDYTMGAKGSNRGLVNIEAIASANIGPGFSGANDTASGSGGGSGPGSDGFWYEVTDCPGNTFNVWRQFSG